MLILGLFVLHAAWPVPDANETYYLAKAKHFWNPTWGSGTLFLESGNAHAVFYAAFGWLARWISLDSLAWGIRGLTWALVAWAWRGLSWTILPRRGWAVLSAALFLWANDRFDLAGEWVVGGAEAKGLAYVGVLLALTALVRGAWHWVWPLLGIATSFHVLVGGWSMLAAGWVALRGDPGRPRGRSALVWVVLGLALAAPGLWPALGLNQGVDTKTMTEAARILVFERASHHLSPFDFKAQRYLGHGVLWIVLGVLWWKLRLTDGERRLRSFVGASMGIAATGLLIAGVGRYTSDGGARLLQFYWFRLSDVMVPLGVSLFGLAVLDRGWDSRPRAARLLLGALVLVAAYPFALKPGRLLATRVPRAERVLPDPMAWQDACGWVGEHTPPDAVFLTPRMAASFQWRTGRRDVVNWKDVPQDAAGIVEWRRRMQDLHGGVSPADASPSKVYGEWDRAELLELGRRYRAEYAVIARSDGSGTLPGQVFANRSYAVIRVEATGEDPEAAGGERVKEAP